MDSLIRINQNTYKEKVKKIKYLHPLIYYSIYILIFSIVFSFGVISTNKFIGIITVGGILYFFKVIYLFYYVKDSAPFSEKVSKWSNDNMRKHVRRVIPDDYFKCPAECKKIERYSNSSNKSSRINSSNDYTRRRLVEINRYNYERKRKTINLIVIFMVLFLIMIVPYGFVLSGAISKTIFLIFFIFTMLSYLFYVMYVLNIYNFRDFLSQRIEEVETSRQFMNRRIAEYIDENCDCSDV